jgi:hypothetical protein
MNRNGLQISINCIKYQGKLGSKNSVFSFFYDFGLKTRFFKMVFWTLIKLVGE